MRCGCSALRDTGRAPGGGDSAGRARSGGAVTMRQERYRGALLRDPCRHEVRRFNPHPARRPSATGLVVDLRHRVVSILTRPEGRVLPVLLYLRRDLAADVSILTRPEGRVLPGAVAVHDHVEVAVSILTRPEGRVLPVAARDAVAAVVVSILTRPEGRVLHAPATVEAQDGTFQSSPGPKAECYTAPP
jgi:hypothetical protein